MRALRDKAIGMRPRGFSLVEVLVALALTLVLMGAVATMFGKIGNSVNESRAALEAADRLRSTVAVLQKDLAGLTVTPMPPRRPEDNEGYLEIIEGPVGTSLPMTLPQTVAVDKSDPANPNKPDTTVIDFDDILMFTTRSTGRPFVGRCASAPGGTIESDVAEVAWFVRGRTLYRRVLLVAPTAVISPNPADPPGTYSATNVGDANIQQFYAKNDISVRLEKRGTNYCLIANTLGDLTRRESRFAHPIDNYSNPTNSFPYDVRRWGQLGLPTLQECSSSAWNFWDHSTSVPPANGSWNNLLSPVDFWSNNAADRLADPDSRLVSNPATVTRAAEDVILTNAIGFDVKVWDATAVAYVDLGYGGVVFDSSLSYVNATSFGHLGDVRSGLNATTSAPIMPARVYDTWSSSYLNYNGFDNGSTGVGAGIVDGVGNLASSSYPPYPAPLRGIKVTIRTFEPSSRQPRELSIVQDFLPK